MRYLILSDIHSNLQALEAVLADADGGFDRILCCGDLVGYGADPNPVVDWARANVGAIIRGNHDKACSGSEDLEWFNPIARASAEWTRKVLTPENLEYLKQLPKGPRPVADFQLVHGSPLDEDEYLVSIAEARQVVPYLDWPLSFFGHSHIQGGFLCHRNGVVPLSKPRPEERERVLELERDMLYLVNPGSVGQPRDGDPRAAYALYYPKDRVLIYRRVPYDVEKSQARIREEHLPDALWMRLACGR